MALYLRSVAHHLPTESISSAFIEDQLASVFSTLRLPSGYLAQVTGIEDRRIWPEQMTLSDASVIACQNAIKKAKINAENLDAVLYCGVCREGYEPPTASVVAGKLKVSSHCQAFDISNACLGFLTALEYAESLILSGKAKTICITSCESSKFIIQKTIYELCENPSFEALSEKLATLTGGSGAFAMIVSGDNKSETNSFGNIEKNQMPGPRPLGKMIVSETQTDLQLHDLCYWGLEPHSSSIADAQTKNDSLKGGNPFLRDEIMRTRATEVQKHGIALATRTWNQFKEKCSAIQGLSFTFDKYFCHGVGLSHSLGMYQAFGISPAEDFKVFPKLGNLGSASIPIAFSLYLTLAQQMKEKYFAFLGIGSGISCKMIGFENCSN